jgi:hypothetical protein
VRLPPGEVEVQVLDAVVGEQGVIQERSHREGGVAVLLAVPHIPVGGDDSVVAAVGVLQLRDILRAELVRDGGGLLRLERTRLPSSFWRNSSQESPVLSAYFLDRIGGVIQDHSPML